jgi:tRNA(Ile)-lysidine synthase
VALLHLLLEAGYFNLVVAHFNHQLRGRESGTDASFVRRLAEKLRLPLESGKGDVRREAGLRKLSLETAAREARYAFLCSVAKKHRSRTLLLAHHADDQVETSLFNFLRGSGAAGLAGMKPHSTRNLQGVMMKLHRPLLGVSKSDLLDYLSRHRIPHREDASNKIAGNSRNKLRLKILPEIESLFGSSFRAAIVRSASIFAEEEEFLSGIIEPMASVEKLSVKTLRELHPALRRRLIHAWLKRHGIKEPGFAEVERTSSMLTEGGPAKINLPGNSHARRRGGMLFLENGKKSGVRKRRSAIRPA